MLDKLDAAEIELAARADLASAVRDALPGHAVYIGRPDAQSYVIPQR